MAIINKTGITTGGTIQAEHITRAIDALSGGSTDTIIATGSFSGSLRGVLTGTASFATSASFAPQFFKFVTGSNYTNTLGDNIDLAITGTLSTYAQAGNKGLQRFANAINTLGVWGDIISGDTSLVAGNYEVVYMNAGGKWVAVDQGTYDDTTQPLLGIALDGGKPSGTVLLSGYITAYVSGSLSGSGIPIGPGRTPRLGYAVWVEEGAASGSIRVDQPSSGAIINVGHIVLSGSNELTSQNRLLRINPRYITTI